MGGETHHLFFPKSLRGRRGNRKLYKNASNFYLNLLQICFSSPFPATMTYLACVTFCVILTEVLGELQNSWALITSNNTEKKSCISVRKTNRKEVKKVKVAQSCRTLCDPMYYTVHGFLQARILEWVASPFSRGSSQPRDRTQVSHTAGRSFTIWATRGVHTHSIVSTNFSLSLNTS